MGYLIETVYFLTAALFIIGLKRMSHPTTARSGIVWAGYGMVLATVVSFVHPQIQAGHRQLRADGRSPSPSAARSPGTARRKWR
jgi:NAD/NADP transhydrogenase beta subunit